MAFCPLRSRNLPIARTSRRRRSAAVDLGRDVNGVLVFWGHRTGSTRSCFGAMDRRSRHAFRSAPSTRDLDRVPGRAGTGLTAHPQISGRTHTDAEWARPALLDPTNRTVLRPVATRRTEDGWGITSRFHPTFELTGNDFVVPAQNGPDSRFSTRVSSAAPSTSSGYRRPVDGALPVLPPRQLRCRRLGSDWPLSPLSVDTGPYQDQFRAAAV